MEQYHHTSPVLPKERLFAALRHETPPSIPWVPFAGVHAGKLAGYQAIEILQDRRKLLESLEAVNRIYDPDGQPVIFDLQVEAEILGCHLLWAQNAPPTVATHPHGSSLELPTHLPEASEGRLPMILDTMKAFKQKVGEKTALYGLICGPMTLASHLRGTEIFMDMFDHPDYLADLLAYCGRVASRMVDHYIEAGMDIIAVVDPIVSQVSPRHFNQFLLTPFKTLFDEIRALNIFSSFFVCGDATKNIEVMCQTGPDSISVDENINLPAAKLITDRYNIAIGGNIPLTTRMLLGSQLDNMKYALDLIDAIQPAEGELRNFILSPGCDMPYDVPTENTIGVLQAVRDPQATREMLENYQSSTFANIEVTLPDYAHLVKPLVEVFTLDSDTCAACSYMLNAAKRAVNEFEGGVDLVEYKITLPENIARLMKMEIKNLPAILINGELKYSSIIPGNAELTDSIRKELK